MGDTKHKPTANGPRGDLHALKDYKQTYLRNAIDKFLNKFVFHGDDKVTDDIWCDGVTLIKCFLILADFKDAVSTGNGDNLLILRKQLSISSQYSDSMSLQSRYSSISPMRSAVIKRRGQTLQMSCYG